MKTKTALELVQQIAQGNIREEVADMLIAQAEEIDRLNAKLAEIRQIVKPIVADRTERQLNQLNSERIRQIREIVKEEG